MQETSSALEHSCVALQIAFFVKHTHKWMYGPNKSRIFSTLTEFWINIPI